MKKKHSFRISVIICFVVLAVIISVANGARLVRTTKTFYLENISKIELFDASYGNTVYITKPEKIQELIQPFNSSEFKRGQSSADRTGWRYQLNFYQGSTVTSQIIIMNSERIAFESYFYDIKNGTINVEYYGELLSNHLEESDLVGSWRSDTGNATHFYQDGKGKTEGDDGVYEFVWNVMNLADAFLQSRDSDLRQYMRILSDSATDLGIPWGVDSQVDPSPDGWRYDGYIITMTFDGIDHTFDFAFSIDGQDSLILNTGPLGQRFSPEQSVSERLLWVTYTKEN